MPTKGNRRRALGILLALALIVPGSWWLVQHRLDPSQHAGSAGSAPAGMEPPSFVDPPIPGPVRPVIVDLAKVAPGQFDPNNKFSRWQRGEVDFSKRDRIVSEARFQALKNASRTLAPSLDVQIAEDAIGPAAPTAGTGFDSIDYTECCGGGGNVPPDPEMAAGPNHLIAVVNVAFEVYDKAGTSLHAPTTLQSFMSANPACTNLFDPNALYDEQADRFILGAATRGGRYCAAVSLTGDPTGSWYIYAFPTVSGAEFFDYPHAGVGDDAIYVGANIFLGSFKEGRIYALDKTAMYQGAAAQYASHGLGNGYDTPQPLNLHGWNQGTWPNAGPHQFFADKNYNGRTYAVLSWSDPFGTNLVSENGVVDLNAATGVTAGMPVDVAQSGGGTIDGGDWRPQDFEYRDGFGWTATTIACNPGGGTVNCVRWAQIDLADATVADAGVYASNGTYRTYGDVAANACGDMAVGYTKSSSAMYPSIWYTGRQAGDAAGALQSEAEVKAGEIAYTSFESSPPRRWGDYTGMTIDPDGVTFWYLGEYSKNTGTTSGRWGTYIGSFSFNCGAAPPPDTTPPVRTNGQPSGSLPSNTTTTNLSLSTNEEATCRYDTAAGTLYAAMLKTFSASDGLSHQTTVSGLVDGQSYAYYVRCQDTAGNPNTDDYLISFSVAAAGTPPSVTSIDFVPQALSGSVSGTVTINAQATDDTGVVQVAFFIDGAPLSVDSNASGGWSATWDTTGSDDGSHTVKAVATDGDNTTGELSVDVTVDNATGTASLHIADLDGAVASPGKTWAAQVTATVVDSNGIPVSGATVFGAWSGDVSDASSCTTGVNGTCLQSSIYILKKQTNSIIFTVTDVTNSLTYDASANGDPDGDSNGTAIQVNKDGSTQVPGGNQPPVASFGYGAAGLMVQFNDQSTDPDGSIVAWSWDFGDGSTETAQNPSHTYAADGTYTVNLSVTDNTGGTDSTSQTVSVSETASGVVAHIGDLDNTSVSSGGRWDARVMVTVHDSNDAPVENAVVDALWLAGANGSPSCTTGPDGRCEMVKPNLKNNVASVILHIANITHGTLSLVYDDAANDDPDGDSTGTDITVSHP